MEKSKIDFGIINIDKPVGPTSFTVSSFVRRELTLSKASHLGTLDPKVTGVLPIALGRACRLSSFFMTHDKTYIGILHTHQEQEIKELQKLINKHFMGKITQTPPHKSAVKRAPRIREVYQWKLLEALETKKDFLFITKVEGGTYIRKLCSDLGEMVGGAHMAELRRTQAGIFSEEKMYTLYEFQEAITEYNKGKPKRIESMIVSAEDAIKKVMPIIQVKEFAIKELRKGIPLRAEYLEDKTEYNNLDDDEVFAIFYKTEFIEIAKKELREYRIATPLFVYN